MKTLVIATRYPSARAPAEAADQVLSFAALAEYCEVRLLAPVPWRERIGRPWEWLFVSRERAAEIDVTRPTDWSAAEQEAAPDGPLYRTLRHRAERIRRDFPFDVILAARAYPDAVLAARLARRIGCPLVTVVPGDEIDAWRQEPGREADVRRALGQSHRVIAGSPALREQIVTLGVAPEKLIVQPGVGEDMGKSCFAALTSAMGVSSRAVPAQRGTPSA